MNKADNMLKRVVVLGGDGFCGWPTSLDLSSHGYDVVVVDNLCRRKMDHELGCESLTPIKTMDERLYKWKSLTGKTIEFVNIDVAKNYQALSRVIKDVKPHTIVHFAEQRSAPYSMKSTRHKQYTLENNLAATHNVLCSIVESGMDIHLVHLGTMGVYGYGETNGLTIPEGYLKVYVEVDGDKEPIDILYPANPGSIYHMTKCQDALLFNFYNRNNSVRITDLHQGIVWGTNTEENKLDEFLINRFDYDGDFGTVLNRFLMQAALGHPLTIHGTGGQTRAFIHIKDSVTCIRLAIENPPQKGDRVKIFNQATETHTIINLAKRIAEMLDAQIRYYINPRVETGTNDLRIANKKFIKLGLNPTYLNQGLMAEIYEVARKFKDRCDPSKIYCTSRWRDDIPEDIKGASKPIQ